MSHKHGDNRDREQDTRSTRAAVEYLGFSNRLMVVVDCFYSGNQQRGWSELKMDGER